MRNWAEDSKHENGNYECLCVYCKQSFIGHKRRVVCKACSDVTEFELAWKKCNDLWEAAGKPLPYLAPEYLKAREEFASLIKKQKEMVSCALE